MKNISGETIKNRNTSLLVVEEVCAVSEALVYQISDMKKRKEKIN